MSVLFNHAIRHEFLPQVANPITMVRQSAKRMHAPDILDVSELIGLFDQLSHRDRAMVMLDVVTGLRRSELIGLNIHTVLTDHDIQLADLRRTARDRRRAFVVTLSTGSVACMASITGSRNRITPGLTDRSSA